MILPRRKIAVLALEDKDHNLIPLWDTRVSSSKSEVYGVQYHLDGSFSRGGRLVECVMDINTKKLSPGIPVDIYPEGELKKGEKVLYEISHRNLDLATIKDVVFEEYDSQITKGKKMDKWYRERVQTEIDPDSMYIIRNWKPFYILDNGKKIEWEHELYKIHQD